MRYFTPELFQFLRELKKDNNREWFLANKERYEQHVRQPFLRFIQDVGPHLKKISRRIVADPKPTGGSMFRIYRDVRFAEDKSPYKTHAAADFFHEKAGKMMQAPGFYLHLEPGTSFVGGGLWHPDSKTLTFVRNAIVGQSRAWKDARNGIKLQGSKLNRPPKGYPGDHALIEDLKHKDFLSSVEFKDNEVCSEHFLPDFVAACKQISPLVRFLTKAVGLPW